MNGQISICCDLERNVSSDINSANANNAISRFKKDFPDFNCNVSIFVTDKPDALAEQVEKKPVADILIFILPFGFKEGYGDSVSVVTVETLEPVIIRKLELIHADYMLAHSGE